MPDGWRPAVTMRARSHAPCYCQTTAEGDDERFASTQACRTWPGPICGSCWQASCACGYVFDDAAHAVSRWPSGRLQCAACWAELLERMRGPPSAPP